MAAWRFLFAPLNDPTSITGELPVASASLNEVLNDAGASTLMLPLRLQRPDKPEVITRANFDAGKTVVYGERDETVLWGGIVWGISPSIAGDTLAVTCGGFHSYFRRRLIRATQSFSASTDDQLDIARALIDYAQGVPGGDIGVTTTDTNTSGRKRERTYYNYERHWVGEALDQLAAVDDGFDFRYDTFRNPSTGLIETAFRTTYPTTGRATEHVFELGVNITNLEPGYDATNLANQVDAIGSGDGENLLIGTHTDTSALAGYPLLEATVSHSDVRRRSTLRDYARRRVTQGLTPNVAVTFDVLADTIPRLGSYELGDQVRLRASRGWLSINDTYRLTSQTINIAENGAESIQLTAAPLELFA